MSQNVKCLYFFYLEIYIGILTEMGCIFSRGTIEFVFICRQDIVLGCQASSSEQIFTSFFFLIDLYAGKGHEPKDWDHRVDNLHVGTTFHLNKKKVV